jgi:hypothetical protein
LHEINRREQTNSVMKATSAKNRHQLNQLAQELAASRSKSADLRQTKTSVLSGIRQAKEDFLGFSLSSLLSSVELLGSMRLSSPGMSEKRIHRLNSTPTNPPSGGGNGDIHVTFIIHIVAFVAVQVAAQTRRLKCNEIQQVKKQNNKNVYSLYTHHFCFV